MEWDKKQKKQLESSHTSRKSTHINNNLKCKWTKITSQKTHWLNWLNVRQELIICCVQETCSTGKSIH